MEKLIEEVKQEYEGCDEAKARVKFSCHRKAEPANYGSSFLGDAFVVLPEYLDVRSVNDLNAAKVNAMLQETFEWTVPRTEMWFSDHGKLLVDSFLLSDAAKKYIIAKEMASTFNNDTALMTFFLAGSITVFHLLIGMFEKRRKPLGSAEMMGNVMICATTAAMFYFLMRMQRRLIRDQSGNLSATTRGRTNLSDASKHVRNYEKVELVDPEYHKGGVEYYSKIVQRNIALRNLIRSLPYSMSNPVTNEDGSWKKHFWTVENSAPEQLQDLHDWAMGKEKGNLQSNNPLSWMEKKRSQ